ncbi:hypothetical protein [Halorhabdus salina]|uniref:hypothetical protein n=1 Tax=Halorhabdus salina TaxID=2750670 RepID=UPI0015EF1736|nr:hypothetical protein [Halorhabdus salina]
MAGIASGSQSHTLSEFKEDLNNAFEIRDQGGSIEEWRSYLVNQGYSVGDAVYSYPEDHPDGVTNIIEPDHLANKKDLDIHISLVGPKDLSDYGETYAASLDMKYIEDGDLIHDTQGEPPVDLAGFGYHDPHWELITNDLSEATETSENINYRDGSYSTGGLAFDVYDEDLTIVTNGSPTEQCTVFLNPTGDADPEERIVHGDYHHTWNEIEIQGVSINPSGLSVVVSDEAQEWETDTTRYGEEILKLSQADATPPLF